ncbi:MAG TPA: IPT/TIG domain-containing protein [Terriglobales bacterium]|jgi:hypothetical protein|nr:IPT/TIG domain-containing protein [Terriglobales bacterium]
MTNLTTKAIITAPGFIRIITLLIGTACLSAAQSQPTLQITSPSDGAVVSPGQAITVNIVSLTGVTVSAVFVIAENPLLGSGPAHSTPAQLSVTVPSSLSSRSYTLTAIGATSAGQEVQSLPISVHVERPDPPTALTSGSPSVVLESQGQQMPVNISATFADASVMDVTESSNLRYSTSNGNVATVDANGMITAVAAGRASITAAYGGGSQNPLSVSVPITVEPPMLTPSPSSLNFGGDQGVFVGTSTSGQITLTNGTSNPTVGATSITATGDYSETDNCVSSSPLPVGGTCTITVTFSPTVAGTRVGSLTVANNFTIAPAVLPLSGVANNNFAILASPGSQTVPAGGSTAYTPTVSLFAGFSGAVALSVSGLPSGVTATFSPQSINTNGGSSTLTVTTSSSTLAGDYPFTIAGNNGNVSLTQNLVLTVTSAVPAPQISQVTDNTGGTSAISIGSATFVNGSGFGDSQGSSTLTLNGRTVAPYFWSDGSVHAFIPADTVPGSVAVQITTSQGASNTVNITVTGQPTITGINPPSGPAGTQVTVTGTNFGPAPVPNLTGIFMNSGPFMPVVSWSDSQIVVTVPAGAMPISYMFSVLNNGLIASSSAFTVIPSPHITSISPAAGAVGTQVTITGSGFVDTQNLNQVFIGGVAAAVVSWSDTQIVANVPTGAQTGTIYVAVTDASLNYVNSNEVAFTVSGP